MIAIIVMIARIARIVKGAMSVNVVSNVQYVMAVKTQ